jgi:predicted ATPase
MPVIERLHINFRCLRDVEMDFTSPEDGAASPFIALVGPNGAGKTTVLDSIALVATRFLGHGSPRHLKRGWQPDSSIQIHCKDGRIEWPGGGLIPPAFGSQLQKILAIPSGYLPSIPAGKPLSSGYQSGLGPMAFSTSGQRVELVHQWWLRQHMQYPGTTNLDRLWKALEPFLGDLTYLGVNPADHLPMFDARGTSVSCNELSSGERRIILLFLEIAMQCGEDGLVLFDEPEAHFHPRWQQMLRGALAQLLPHGQVIVATHSPHIVEGLPAHQLFMLGEQPW